MAQLPVGSGWHNAKARRMSATLAFMQAVAGNGEGLMKANAVWTDRTGHARGGLHAEAELLSAPIVTTIKATYAHTMEYGKWLETVLGAAQGQRAQMSLSQLEDPANVGPYGIVIPTIQQQIPQVRAGLLKIWS